jgi:hypothetical protein
MSGRKISGIHTTVTAPAKVVVLFANAMDEVKCVSLHEITRAKGATNADPRISVRQLNPQTLLVKVLAKGHAQVLWVSTRDQKKVLQALNERFASAK